jgi:hypothetical protein
MKSAAWYSALPGRFGNESGASRFSLRGNGHHRFIGLDVQVFDSPACIAVFVFLMLGT